MSNPIIAVENLGKKYRIGLKDAEDRNFGQMVRSTISSPFRYLQTMMRPETEEETLWAIRNVDFTVDEGEALGLIGHNGAGKSTLLKILARITEPSEGRVTMHGRMSSLLEVGTGFHPDLTGRENVYMNGAILGMSKIEIDRKFDEIVEFSDVEKFLDTPVKRYSSGMRVRLAFAVAAHLEPEILIVDEVLSVGDAEFQRKCIGKMTAAAKSGRTVLFVSHNMSAVENLCHRALWLSHGRILKEGGASEIVSEYLRATEPPLNEQIWEDVETAPGNEFVRLHRVRVRPESGEPNEPITMTSPLVVEIEFWNLKEIANLDVTLHFTTEQGVVAFGTNTGHWLGWERDAMTTGIIRATCYVPGNLLNTGMYRIMVRFVRNQSNVLFRYEDALAFEVKDNPEMRGYWYGKPIGAVRPRLKWSLEHVTEDGLFVPALISSNGRDK